MVKDQYEYSHDAREQVQFERTLIYPPDPLQRLHQFSTCLPKQPNFVAAAVPHYSAPYDFARIIEAHVFNWVDHVDVTAIPTSTEWRGVHDIVLLRNLLWVDLTLAWK